jgi:hypothetical protein
VTRAFDDSPEINRQQNIVFAFEYQRYWVSLFSQPLLVAEMPSAPAAKGVVENRVILGKVPDCYIELLDETTMSRTETDTEFAIVPSRTATSRQGQD